jgi:digeranylgeranylglycerophospholipid reductase
LDSLPDSKNPAQVVVIGASAAGLHAATLLAGRGVRVLVFDQQERVGPPARTLISTPRLKHVLGFVPDEAIVNRTATLQMISPRRSAAVRLSQPDWILERATLLSLLARRATAAGVETLAGYRFLGLEPDGDAVLVHLESATGRSVTVPARTLIGADGVDSQVARALSRGGFAPATVYNLQAVVPMPAWASRDTTQVWFDPALTPYFAWLIPESRERAVAGLIAADERQAREGLGRFLAAHALDPVCLQGGEVPLHAPHGVRRRKVGEAEVLLVGDAAGQVKVTTVGGLVTGLRGAQAAVRAIVRRTPYERELGALERELDGHLWVRRALNRFTARDYDQLLALLNARTREVLAARTRDEALRVLLGVALAQPGFALLAVRCLLRGGTARPASAAPSAQSAA